MIKSRSDSPTQEVMPLSVPRELAERIEMLEYVTAKYSGTFDTVSKTCKRLLRYQNVCVLLDFDVLHNYIVSGISHPTEILALDHFLEKGSMRFALPVGAFRELLEYITSHSRVNSRVKDLLGQELDGANLNKSEALVFVAESMGIRSPEQLSTARLEMRTGSKLAQIGDQLSRLLRVLKHSRFGGVRGEYPKRNFEGWLELLRAIPRRHAKKESTRVLQRDAMNLAVAAQAFLDSAAGRMRTASPEGYILVTQTESLLMLAEYAEYDREIQELATKWFRADFYRSRSQYPVLRPSDLVTLELLGGASSSQSLSLTKIRSEKCKGVFNILKNEIETLRPNEDQSSSADASPSASLDYRQRWRKQQLSHLLRDLAIGLHNADAHHTFLDIEAFRASSDALDLNERASQNLSETAETELKRKALHFRRVFSEVSDALAGGVAYSQSRVPSDAGEPFTRIEIRLSHDEHPVIDGEIYQDAEGGSRYFLHWKVTCTDADFISALKLVATPVADFLDVQKRERTLQKLTDGHHPLRRNGIVIETNVGIFGMPIGKEFTWDELGLGRIMPQLRSLGPIGGATPVTQGGELLVHRLRVCGPPGECVFDFFPREGQSELQCTVASHFNLARLISTLCARTAARYIVSSSLEDALSKLLSKFPVFRKVRDAA